LELVHAEGEEWVNGHLDDKFDDVFRIPGKANTFFGGVGNDQAEGFYMVDDMLLQPNGPERHQEKALRFVAHLECRRDLVLTKQHRSTGIIVAVKK